MCYVIFFVLPEYPVQLYLVYSRKGAENCVLTLCRDRVEVPLRMGQPLTKLQADIINTLQNIAYYIK